MSLCSLPSTCMPEITAEPSRNATIPVCLSIFYTVFPKDKNLWTTPGHRQPVSLKLVSTNLSCPNPPTLNPDARICRWEYVGSCRATHFHNGPNLLPSQQMKVNDRSEASRSSRDDPIGLQMFQRFQSNQRTTELTKQGLIWNNTNINVIQYISCIDRKVCMTV